MGPAFSGTWASCTTGGGWTYLQVPVDLQVLKGGCRHMAMLKCLEMGGVTES